MAEGWLNKLQNKINVNLREKKTIGSNLIFLGESPIFSISLLTRAHVFRKTITEAWWFYQRIFFLEHLKNQYCNEGNSISHWAPFTRDSRDIVYLNYNKIVDCSSFVSGRWLARLGPVVGQPAQHHPEHHLPGHASFTNQTFHVHTVVKIFATLRALSLLAWN
jgi:hypothetical protein